jgi:prepilin-type N-terminal cleavage/methylation domain-containing protein
MNKRSFINARRGEKGFTLVELLVALALGMIALAAFYSVFFIQQQRFDVEEQVVELQQNIRSGMDVMVMEIRMAGFDSSSANNFDGVTVNANQLEIRADLDGNGAIAGAEHVIYAYDAGNLRITRNIGAGAQPFMENIQAFAFQYLDADGVATANSVLVRQISISITGRTARRDPKWTANDGFRTYTLTANVTPRNLAY